MMIDFCNPESLDSRKLFDLLGRIIRLNHAEFAGVYRTLRRAFEQTSAAPVEDDYVQMPLTLVNPDLPLGGNSQYPGIDLPCWIEAPNSNQTIVLLGQDPLRDADYFTAPVGTPPYVVIGTPYSVHSRALRTTGNQPRYWAVIDALLGAGYGLYLTDIAKFWATGQRAPRPAAATTYSTILRGELDLVSRSRGPVFVVAFGIPAARALYALAGMPLSATTKLSESKAEVESVGSMRVIRVLHPSSQNTPKMGAYLAANDIDPVKGVAGLADVIKQAIRRFGSA